MGVRRAIIVALFALSACSYSGWLLTLTNNTDHALTIVTWDDFENGAADNTKVLLADPGEQITFSLTRFVRITDGISIWDYDVDTDSFRLLVQTWIEVFRKQHGLPDDFEIDGGELRLEIGKGGTITWSPEGAAEIFIEPTRRFELDPGEKLEESCWISGAYPSVAKDGKPMRQGINCIAFTPFFHPFLLGFCSAYGSAGVSIMALLTAELMPLWDFDAWKEFATVWAQTGRKGCRWLWFNAGGNWPLVPELPQAEALNAPSLRQAQDQYEG